MKPYGYGYGEGDGFGDDYGDGFGWGFGDGFGGIDGDGKIEFNINDCDEGSGYDTSTEIKIGD
jgi:hypothetical protein